jgi:hypothetical protein
MTKKPCRCVGALPIDRRYRKQLQPELWILDLLGWIE